MRRGAAFACLAVAALSASPAFAQAVAVAPSGRIAVAHDSVLELYEADAKTRVWSTEGLSYVSTLVVGETKLAAVDAIGGRVIIADLAGGHGARLQVGGSPVDALFVRDDLYMIDRDAGALERIAGDGARASAPTGRYPQLLRRRGGTLYVYAAAGELDEFSTDPLARSRSVAVPPFATDLELEAGFAYLACADEPKLVAFVLGPLRAAGEKAIGGFPTGLAIVSGEEPDVGDSTAYDLWLDYKQWFGQAGGQIGRLVEPPPPLLLAVADPASRSVLQVRVERSGPTEFGSSRRSSLPTPADRVFAWSQGWVAYDSASRVLYSLVKGKAAQIARDVGPHAFGVSAGAVAFWNGALAAKRP